MPNNFLKSWLIPLILLLYGNNSHLLAYGTAVHEKICEKSITLSTLDAKLKLYGYNNGIDAIINLKTDNGDVIDKKDAKKWITGGGVTEDEGKGGQEDYLTTRAFNHFHDPLRVWNEAYFHSVLTSSYLSSYGRDPASALVWGVNPGSQDFPENTTGDWSWPKARLSLFNSLVSPTNTDRDNNFTNCLRALGQVMHLLQDMSVPAHTRNDAHILPLTTNPFTDEPLEDPILGSWHYETYTSGLLKKNPTDFQDILDKPSVDPNLSAFNSPNQDPQYTSLCPVTGLFDRNTYTADSIIPAEDENDIGLSEFTNASFLSKDTIWSNDYPHPAKSDTNYGSINWDNLSSLLARDGELDNVAYFHRYTNGIKSYRMAALRYFTEELYLDNSIKLVHLDEKVFKNYAEQLIPRAVGYSTALLNYFFRGTLEISHPDQFVYSVIDGSQPHQFGAITANIRNTSHLTDGDGNDIPEEIGAGELVAVARYRIIPNYLANLSSYPQNAAELQTLMGNVEYSYSVSQPLVIDPALNPVESSAPSEFTFDFSGNEIPAGITDLTLQIVFLGTLGNEIDTGVAVGMIDLNEPAHFIFANSTDEIIMNGVLTTADEIKNNAFLAAQVDWDSDGIFNEVVIVDGVNIGEPYIDPYDVSLQIGFSISDPQLEPNAVLSYPITIDHLPAGRYASMVLLIDVASGNEYWTETLVARHFGAETEYHTYLTGFAGVYMQEGIPDWHYTPLEPIDYVHRGAYQHHLMGEYYCVGESCPYLGEERIDYSDMNPFPWAPLP
jgi:hypothetical protein